MNNSGKSQTYEFEYCNNHFVVIIDGKAFLIDTGSPVSFSTNGNLRSISINDKKFDLTNNPMRLDIEKIENFVGREIDGFIGLDIITDLGSLYVNKSQSTVMFGDDSMSGSGTQMELQRKSMMMFNYLMTDVAINGTPVSAVVDTGACISYVSSELITDSKCTGTISDYGPGLGGYIETEKYEVEFTVDEQSENVEMARMTGEIEMGARAMGCKAFIGFGEIEWSELLIDVENCRIAYL